MITKVKTSSRMHQEAMMFQKLGSMAKMPLAMRRGDGEMTSMGATNLIGGHF